MKAYVARFSMPSNPQEVHRMFNNWGSLATDLDGILAGSDLNWSLPNSVFANDIVFFQYTSSSKKNLTELEAAAKAENDAKVLEYLSTAKKRVLAHIGHIVGVGRVRGVAERSAPEDGAHFRQRLFAPVSNVHAFRCPLRVSSPSPLCRLPEFMPGGSLVNRAFASDDNYQRVLAELEKLGNILPVIIAGTHIQPVLGGKPLSEDTWIEYVTDPDIGFFLEAHLRLTFANYLLNAIADNHQLYDEVLVIKSGKAMGFVDSVIRVSGELLPVEVKLNAAGEADLLKQVRKYTRADRLLRDGDDLGNATHDVVLLIDQRGIYIMRGGEFWNCGIDRAWLARNAITKTTLADLQLCLSKLIGGASSELLNVGDDTPKASDDENLTDALIRIAANPRNVRAQFDAGEACRMLDRYEEAIKFIRASIEIGGEDADAQDSLARCYDGLGDSTNARKCARLAVELAPQHVEYAIFEAHLLWAAEERESALAILEKLTIQHPDAGDAWSALAVYLDETDDAKPENISIFREAARRNATDAEVQMAAGRAHYLIGSSQVAASYLSRAIRLFLIDSDPDLRFSVAQCYVTLGQCHSAEGQGEEELSCYQRALEFDSEHDGALRLLAEQVVDVDCEEAARYFERLLRLVPDDEEARLGYAKCLLQLERFDEARAHLRALANSTDLDSIDMQDVGSGLLAAGDYEAGMRIALRLVQEDPGSSWVRRLYADALRAVGRTDEAVEMYQQLGSGDSAFSGIAHHALGAICRSRGDMAGARAHLEESISGSATTTSCLRELGLVYFEQGEFAKAVEYLSLCSDELDGDKEVISALAIAIEKAGPPSEGTDGDVDAQTSGVEEERF